jgi:hypothetical protein
MQQNNKKSILDQSFTKWNRLTGKWNTPSQVFRYIVGLDFQGEVLFKLPLNHDCVLSDFWSSQINSCHNVQYRYYTSECENELMREDV